MLHTCVTKAFIFVKRSTRSSRQESDTSMVVVFEVMNLGEGWMSPLVPSCRLSYSFIVGRFRVCFVCLSC